MRKRLRLYKGVVVCILQTMVLRVVFGKKISDEILQAWKFLTKRRVAGYSVRHCYTCMEGEIQKRAKGKP